MWWVLAGAVLGGLAGEVAGALLGAILGAFAWMIARGLAIRRAEGVRPTGGARATPMRRADAVERRLDVIEQRLARLENAMAALRVPSASAEPAARAAPLAAPADTAPGFEAPMPAAPPVRTESRAESLEEALARIEAEQRAMTPPVGPERAPDAVPSPPPVPVVHSDAADPSARLEAPAEPPVAAPETPPAPAWWERLASGNIVAKVGVVVLFFGVAFLLKYAYDRAMFPPELRLAAVAAAAVAMYFVGSRLLAERPLYALIVQGGALGLAYLDVFFALRWFDLIGPGLAFALFAVLGAVTVLLAVRRDARPLAVLGLLGAFAAPPLASTGGGSHVALFSYYLLLNAFVLAISWRKSWRELNVIGFAFTFVIGALWGARYYQPRYFASVEPFLLAFFAIYLVIPILFARRQPPELKGLVDGTLVFGTPLAAGLLQAALVRDLPHGLAWSAAGGALLYAALAAYALRDAALKLLGETYVALATVLATLAVFFAFDAYPTFALWTLEGAALLWVGLRQRRVLAQASGLALQVLAAGYFLASIDWATPPSPYWNTTVVGAALVAVAGILSAFLLRGAETGWRAVAGRALILWALAWWLGGALYAFDLGLAQGPRTAAALVFAALTFGAMELAGARLGWRALRDATALHVLVLAAGVLAQLVLWDVRIARHPLADFGAAAWPLGFAIHFWILLRQARDRVTTLHRVRYAAGWAMALFLATWEGAWLVDTGRDALAMAWGAAGVAAAWLRWRLRERDAASARAFSGWLIAWSLVWWALGGVGLVREHLPIEWKLGADLLFAAATAVGLEALGSALGWRAARRAQIVLLLALVVGAVTTVGSGGHPFAFGGALGWIVGLATHYVLLARQERGGVVALPRVQHLASAWLAVALATWEAAWQCDRWALGAGWQVAAWVVPAAAAMLGIAWLSRARRWPFPRHAGAYASGLALPLAVVATTWWITGAMQSDGSARPWAFVPLLNPLDLAHALVLAALWHGARRFLLPSAPEYRGAVTALLGGLAFLWLNAILLRTVHHWAGVPFALQPLLDSVLTQAALSLVWTVTAFVLMLTATRRVARGLWVTGAVLLAAVVLKLFLNDLGNSGTVARIVTFIGVGVLLLGIGYLAPVPPGRAESRAQ